VPPRAVELTLRTQDLGELRYLFRIGSDHPQIPPRHSASSGQTSTVGDLTGGTEQTGAVPPANPGDFP
jgi:general secretion pathway protein J